MSNSRYYPRPTGNDDLRIAYDKIYALEDQMNQKPAPVQAQQAGMTVTVFFPGGFQISSGGPTYNNMTFQGGRLVGIS